LSFSKFLRVNTKSNFSRRKRPRFWEPVSDVGKSEIQNLKLLSASSVTALSVQVSVDGIARTPQKITLTWTPVSSGVPITTYGTSDGLVWTLPAGDMFELTVSDIPADLKMKAIRNAAGPIPAGPSQKIISGPTNIFIVLESK
jgi:hypothetical protein